MQPSSDPLNPGQFGDPSRTFRGFAHEARLLCSELGAGSIDTRAFLEQCTRLTNTAITCSRTGIWMFVETAEGRVLRCLAMYDAIGDRMALVPDEGNEVQPYFSALDKTGFVSAVDVGLHPATKGLFAQRLSGNGVRSLLAASCSVNGHLFGALTCTQVGERKEWTAKQLAMLRQIGSPASLALHRASRFTANTGHGLLLD